MSPSRVALIVCATGLLAIGGRACLDAEALESSESTPRAMNGSDATTPRRSALRGIPSDRTPIERAGDSVGPDPVGAASSDVQTWPRDPASIEPSEFSSKGDLLRHYWGDLWPEIESELATFTGGSFDLDASPEMLSLGDQRADFLDYLKRSLDEETSAFTEKMLAPYDPLDLTAKRFGSLVGAKSIDDGSRRTLEQALAGTVDKIMYEAAVRGDALGRVGLAAYDDPDTTVIHPIYYPRQDSGGSIRGWLFFRRISRGGWVFDIRIPKASHPEFALWDESIRELRKQAQRICVEHLSQ